jgi:multiple sugar transport system permease protein
MTTPTIASAVARTTPARARSLSDRAVANLFLLPTILLLVAMNLFPLLWSLWLSFTRYHADSPRDAPVWIGNANYQDMLADGDVWQAFTTTAAFVLLAVGLQLLIGLGLALLLNRPFQFKGIVTTLFLLPMMLSSAVVGLFWKFLLDPTFGLVDHLLGVLHLLPGGVPINWFDRDHALWAVVLADSWMWSPFVMLIALAGLSSVPATMYEAASVDRASEWFKFRYITLPMIAPLLMVALLFRTLDSFKMFDLAWIMTSGGIANSAETVSIQVYRRALMDWDTGHACALAYIVLLVIIGLTNLYLLLLARVKGEATPDAQPLFGVALDRAGRSPLMPLLRRGVPWLAGALAVFVLLRAGGVAALVVAGVLLLFAALLFRLPAGVKTPLAYLGMAVALAVALLPIYWIVATSLKTFDAANSSQPTLLFQPTLASYAALFHPAPDASDDAVAFGRQLLGSLIVAVTSTILAVGLGTLAAYSFSRFRIKAKSDALFFILSTRMLPPVVIVVPVYLMFRAIHLLNSLAGLVLLYTTVGVAFATWLMKGFTDDVPPEYEEAALLDRYTRLQAFRKTTLPLIVPGMAATAVFCFLNAWNEYAFAYFLSGAEPLTAPPSITDAVGAGSTPWNDIAARAVIFLVPAALFTFLMRKHLLRGMTFGAIKGR